MTISPRKSRCLLLALTLLLPACLERKETVTLNPDGSGKAVIDTLMPVPPMPVDAPKMDAVAFAKQVAGSMAMKAQGVDAWKDLVVDASPDGRAHVAITAYFPDISKFRLDAPIVTSWTKDASGNYTLLVKKDNPPSPTTAPAMTDAQVATAITSAKAEYKQDQPTMQMFLSALKIENVFVLPGAVSATNILTKAGDNTAALTIDGKPMLAAMDKIMSDDKLLATAVRVGQNTEASDNLLVQNMFGKPGPLSATVTGPVKDQFDYKAESAAAKAAQGGMFEKAGISATPAPMMPPGAAPAPGNP